MKDYSIDRWEIDHYETRLCLFGFEGKRIHFASEEGAVTYGRRYIKEHPGWSFRVYKIQRSYFEYKK